MALLALHPSDVVYNMKILLIKIPGQIANLQGFVEESCPTQLFAFVPFGSGLLQSRPLVWTPVPHVFEHLVHSDH